MKISINTRFSEAVDFIINVDKTTNKSKIAAKLDIKPSTFSEILKIRSNVSAETISMFCLLYEISPEWLLTGKGDMLKGSIVPKPIIPEDVGKIAMLEGIIRDKDDIIDGLKFKVATLEKEIRANEDGAPYILDKKTTLAPELV